MKIHSFKATVGSHVTETMKATYDLRLNRQKIINSVDFGIYTGCDLQSPGFHFLFDPSPVLLHMWTVAKNVF